MAASALATVLAAASVLGCDGSRSGTSGSGERTETASPSALPPAELCRRAVVYWAPEVMKGDTYGDYQKMGLSNRQYDILREVVADARVVLKAEGDAAARRTIARQAREKCTARYRDGTPTEGPWER
ncbi:hypothetical protein [Streptomyces sp. CRN 30]|uniref:hypothetical protein n=1 Tax=Streptomyces sp. CRN 30 TaxID=3075613 RepID=UPI002A82F373|nr:hypothetical protein [Streptomyces sp. CRN 30]